MDNLENAVRDFFKLLDTVEVSDNGRPFFPHMISTVRCMSYQQWNPILERMRDLSGAGPRPDLSKYEYE